MYDDYIYYIAPKPFVKAATKVSHRYFKVTISLMPRALACSSSSGRTGPSPMTTRWMLSSGFKFIAKHSNALTGPSQKCQEYFRLTGLKKDVNVIPNAVEVD